MQKNLSHINITLFYIYNDEPSEDTPVTHDERGCVPMDMFYILNHWHWWALGTLLVVAELLTPCVYFIAIGIAAVLVGLVTRFFMPEMAGLWQLGLFIGLTLVNTGIAYRIRNTPRRSN